MTLIIDELDIPVLRDLVAVTSKGVPERLVEDKTINYLINLIHPISFGDKEDIYFYWDGVYRDGGEELIKQILNKGLITFRNAYNEPIITIRQSREIVEKIKYLCMDERENFDKDLEIINMRNGLYNWRTGEFKNHTHEYKSLIQIPVTYNPTAECPTHIEVLSEIVPKKYFKLVLEYFAYLLYREYKIQNSLILYGPGGTGKSEFLDMMRRLIGENNCVSYSLHDLSNKNFAIAKLYGKSLNECGELDNVAITKTGIFKQCTSRKDVLTGDRKFLDPIYFVNFAKFVFAANELCPIADQSTGFWRRFIILEFSRVYKREEYNYERLDKLKTDEEVSGLFNLVVPLLKNIIDKGYFEDAPTAEETRELYAKLSDPIKVFAREGIFEDPSNSGIMKGLMYDSYRKLCFKYRQTPLHINDFNKEIQKLAPYLKSGQKYDNQLRKKRPSWINVSLSNVFE